MKLPSTTPTTLVVIVLWAGPKHIQMNHVNVTKAFFRYGTFEQLHGCIQTILFDHKQAFTCLVSSLNHALTIM
jgi:hypothetical protein